MVYFSKEYCVKYMENFPYNFSIEEIKENISPWNYIDILYVKDIDLMVFFKDKKYGNVFFIYSSNNFSKMCRREGFG